MDGDPVIPPPLDDDDDDVAWALQTAAVQWQRGARADAVVWLRRAVDAAISAGNPGRTKDLTKLAAGVADRLVLEAMAQPDSAAPPARISNVPSVNEVDELLTEAPRPPPPPPRPSPPRPSAHSLSGVIPLEVEEPAEEEEFEEDDAPTIPPPPDVVQALVSGVPEAPRAPPNDAGFDGPTSPWDLGRGSRHDAPTVDRETEVSSSDLYADLVDDDEPESAPRPDAAALVPASGSPDTDPEPVSDMADTTEEPVVFTRPDGAESNPSTEPTLDTTVTERKASATEPAFDTTVTERKAPAPIVEAGPPIVDEIHLSSVRGLEDLPEETQQRLARSAVITELSAEEEIGAFGAALVTRGRVGIMPAIADVAAGIASPGDVVFTRGTLDDGIVLRVVALEENTRVASWSSEVLEAAMADCPWVGDELRLVADRFQALAGSMLGPLGDRFDDTLRGLVTSRLDVKAYGPGETIVTQGKPVPGLHVIGAGRIELLDGEAVTDEVGPGDFLFAAEVLSAGVAHASARAGKTGALVLFASRSVAHELLVSVPPLLELLAG